MTPTDADLTQVAKGIRSQRMNYADDTGSVNNLSCSFDPPLGSYTIGLIIRVKIYATNTGQCTIDAGAGRVPVKLMNGAGCQAGDLPAGAVAEMVYDGTGFQLVNFMGLGGGAGEETTYYVNIPYAVDTSPTPNIVVASFSPAITALKAGDPVLVKIANTNTGSSVIKVNALADQQVKPNGGGPLLQGDMAVGDVVLFIYDGVQFIITPNPFISANCTVNVPSQFADVMTALAILKRKTIAAAAMVTIQIQGGSPGAPYVIKPFTINHANADRITIKGTMLAAPPSWTNFAQTGASPAARAADSANNIVMLRSRYGTEIKISNGSPENGEFDGIYNVGPGRPTLQDLLVTGPNYSGVDAAHPVGRWTGPRCDGGHLMLCYNVAVWGVDHGFYCGGSVMITNSCSACGCFGMGFMMTGGGTFGTSNCWALGNTKYGMSVNQNAWMGTAGCVIQCNGDLGVGCGDASQFTLHSSICMSNGYPTPLDVNAAVLSEVVIIGNSSYGVCSPSPGVFGNYNAIIVVGQ
jgi:hypothetical protein